MQTDDNDDPLHFNEFFEICINDDQVRLIVLYRSCPSVGYVLLVHPFEAIFYSSFTLLGMFREKHRRTNDGKIKFDCSDFLAISGKCSRNIQ